MDQAVERDHRVEAGDAELAGREVGTYEPGGGDEAAAAAALVDGGVLVATVGWDAWTGTDNHWLGGDAEMWWSQADHATYRRWLEQADLRIETMEFIADGDSGHALFWATRTRPGPGSPPATN